jgi:hypothetical protein
MPAALVLLLRSFGLICCGYRGVALENLALRQQLAALRRTAKRPQLRTSDRVFWVLLAKAWPDRRSALIIVRPDTVVRWHGSGDVGGTAPHNAVPAARARMRAFAPS